MLRVAPSRPGAAAVPVREAEASRRGAQEQHAGEQTGEPGVRHHRVHPRRPHHARVVVVVEHERVGGERHHLPREEKGRRVPGERNHAHREQEDEVGDTALYLSPGPVQRINRRGHGGAADEEEEEAGEGIHAQLEAAQRHEPRNLNGPLSAEQAGESQSRRAESGHGPADEGEGGHQRRRPMASRRPAEERHRRGRAAGDHAVHGHDGSDASHDGIRALKDAAVAPAVAGGDHDLGIRGRLPREAERLGHVQGDGAGDEEAVGVAG